MQIFVDSPEEYLSRIPEHQRAAVSKLRNILLENLPDGFEECMIFGMLGYVVPHRIYPAGYYVNPEQPLLFMNLAAQKNFIAVYHMALYTDTKLLEWFRTEYAKLSKYKLDMGKGCIRFKKTEAIPYELIAELSQKINLKDWIEHYETFILKK